MASRIYLQSFFLIVFFAFSSVKTFSQCLQIETILVDACDDSGDEGFNEMVRFKVGPNPINVGTMNVNWPSQAWQGLVINTLTTFKVNTLNTQIAALGGCGQLIQTSGQIPANAKVILITSQNFSLTANAFGALTEDVYILFQNNPTTTGGHFGNYNAASGIRTLTISYGGGCSDSVSYDRSLLVDANGLPGAANGATVNFNAAGNPTYTNEGCVAPVDVFTVDAGSPASACVGATIALTGTAQGQASVVWSAPSGSFSNSGSLTTNYTLPVTAGSSITLTLTATNSCGNSIHDTVTITVSPGTMPTFTPVAPICSGSTLSPLPTTSLNGITGTWLPALSNTLGQPYNFTPTAGQCASPTSMTITVNPGPVPTFTPVAPICSGGVLSPLPTTSLEGITGTWLPALSNTLTQPYNFTPTTGQCASPTSITITVNPSPVPTFTQVAPICNGGTLSPLPTTSLEGITGSWLPALSNTLTQPYNFTPTAGQCASSTSMTITVNPTQTATFTPVAPICSGGTLAPLPTTSLEGITGSWSPALSNTLTQPYTFTPTPGQCSTQIVRMTITVNNASIVPTFTPVAPVCNGTALTPLPTTSLNGITGTWTPALSNTLTQPYNFTPNPGQCALGNSLTITVIQKVMPTFTAVAPICNGTALSPLPTTSLNGFLGSWSPALDNTITKAYTFTPNTGQCANTASLTITVNQKTTPNFSSTFETCSGGNVPTLASTSPNGITGTWTPNSISNTIGNVYSFMPTSGLCANPTSLTVTITPNPVLTEKEYVCFDAAGQVISQATIDTGLSASNYTFSWTFNGNPIAHTGPFYQTSQIGDYQVIATNTTTNCSVTVNATVQSSPMAAATAYVNGDFADVQEIIVEVSGGTGQFLYQLDHGPFQSSNVFFITRGGDYTIHVKDASGCNTFELHVTALNFPKFFTPNNDGYNDTWNIDGLQPGQEGEITIFDRYGKLLKQISARGNGWDGIYNGKMLPSTDYWFVISYRSVSGQAKTFRSHFSLKR